MCGAERLPVGERSEVSATKQGSEGVVSPVTHNSRSGSSGASHNRLFKRNFSRKGRLIKSGAPDRYRSSSTMPKLEGGTSMLEDGVEWVGCLV